MIKKNSKILLAVASIIMIIVNMRQLNTNIYGALGASVWDLVVWGIVVGGFVIFNAFLAIYNLFKPDNKLLLTWIDRISFGLIVGIIFKILFNLKF